ncbi:SET domain-containing protein [archaeon]|nr:MAG: SET domain-containing protein [archaeon]
MLCADQSTQTHEHKIMEEKDVSAVSWYPSPPPDMISAARVPVVREEEPKLRNDYAFRDLHVRYVTTNQWHAVTKAEAQISRRQRVKGVEVKKLGADHVLCGQYGLFATERFNRFDVLGEYTGKIVGDTVNGHYVACLEDKSHDASLGIDAEKMGNEMRFINSYLNVAFKPNVTMRTAYVDTYPHIVLVCTEDIYVGDEILLDYGDAYNKAYLLPKPTVTVTSDLTTEQMCATLPFGGSSSDEEDS